MFGASTECLGHATPVHLCDQMCRASTPRRVPNQATLPSPWARKWRDLPPGHGRTQQPAELEPQLPATNTCLLGLQAEMAHKSTAHAVVPLTAWSGARQLRLLALVLACVALAHPASSQSDAELLLGFKDELDNGQTALSMWPDGPNPCDWEGITCNSEGNVTEMWVGQGRTWLPWVGLWSAHYWRAAGATT